MMNIEGGKLVLNQQRLSYKILGAITVLIQIVSSVNGSLNNFSTTNPNNYNEADINGPVSFDLPIPPPKYPPAPGSGFAAGSIDLGGIVVYEALSFQKVWATYSSGPDDKGASFYEPVNIPPGYTLLGLYGRPNSVPLYAAVLVAKDVTGGDEISGLLTTPINYTLVWSSKDIINIKKEGDAYIWLPVPRNNSYKAMGYVITYSPLMPSLQKVRCVHADFTDSLEVDTWVWGVKKNRSSDPINMYSTKPLTRGPTSLSVPTGTFLVQIGNTHSHDIACLKRVNNNTYSAMPRASQIGVMVRAYAPWVYLHPDEQYLPSSVQFFFVNGVMLHKPGQMASSPVKGDGDNLPTNGSVDDAYLDLPDDKATKEKIKGGSLQYIMSYIHVKPALGATFTDVAIWLYYPFNGGGLFQLGPFTIDLGRIGQHVSDWEHITLRIDNFHGNLKAVYLSRHAAGTWVNAGEFEYLNGTTRPVVYASLHGHAHYAKEHFHLKAGFEMDSREMQELEELCKELEMEGEIAEGEKFIGVGVLDKTAKSDKVYDIAANFQVIRVDYDVFDMEPWVNYTGRWGPKVTYRFTREVQKIANKLPRKIRKVAIKLLNKLPPELRGEEGPSGPAMRDTWTGDENV